MIRALLAGAALCAAASLACARPAAAQVDLISPEAFAGLVDLRAVYADGEKSFVDGGFGKLRYGGDATGGGLPRLDAADAALVWKPKFSWALGGIFDVEAQPEQRPNIDLVQGYLTYKPLPRGDLKFSARAGLYWPEISLEHGGPTWSVVETITPSAINSWVGEELKVLGAEAKVSKHFGDHELGLTGGVFTDDDTSGTLLSFRGWALHDLKSTASDSFPLPPLSPFMARRQARETRSRREIDHRIGYYGRLDWRPPVPVSVNLIYYDNRGDRTGVINQQWAWETRFWNLGATARLGDKLRLSSQVLTGRTWMGFPTANAGLWVDMKFSSAYLLATYPLGQDSVSARLDWFETKDQSTKIVDNNDEDGWAALLAWRHRLDDHFSLLVEAMQVKSDRTGRVYGGLDPDQRQSQLQTALRFSF